MFLILLSSNYPPQKSQECISPSCIRLPVYPHFCQCLVIEICFASLEGKNWILMVVLICISCWVRLSIFFYICWYLIFFFWTLYPVLIFLSGYSSFLFFMSSLYIKEMISFVLQNFLIVYFAPRQSLAPHTASITYSFALWVDDS